jgi:hypothetical protein
MDGQIHYATTLASVQKTRIKAREEAKYKDELQVKSQEFQYKSQLLEHELQIERHAAQLGHAKLIEKRIEIIDQSYKHLVNLHNMVQDSIRPDYFGRDKPSTKEAYELALPLFDAFTHHFESNKIYFSKGFAKSISGFYVSAAQALDQARVVFNSGEKLSEGVTKDLQSLFIKAIGDTESARNEIENQFRGILRVEEI